MMRLLTLAFLLAAVVGLMAMTACDGDPSTTDPAGISDGRAYTEPPTVGPTQRPTAGPTQRPTTGTGVGATPTPPPTIRSISPTPLPTPKVEVVPGLPADSFIAVVPKRLRAGYAERVSVSLFNGDHPVAGEVRLSLFDGENLAASVEATVERGGQPGAPRSAHGAGPLLDRG